MLTAPVSKQLMDRIRICQIIAMETGHGRTDAGHPAQRPCKALVQMALDGQEKHAQ